MTTKEDKMKRRLAAAAALAVAALAAPAAAAATTVSLRHTSHGGILADQRGRTLYLFGADSPGRSRCSGSCAANWPPLLVAGGVHAGRGVNAHRLGTISRGHGRRQVTYAGHPLYEFIGDSAPGQANGEGVNAFGALWYVLNAAGNAA